LPTAAARGITWTFEGSTRVLDSRSSAVFRDGVTIASARRTAARRPSRNKVRQSRGKNCGDTKKARSWTVTTRRCSGPAGGTDAGDGACSTSSEDTPGGRAGRAMMFHRGYRNRVPDGSSSTQNRRIHRSGIASGNRAWNSVTSRLGS
jgi:hypothetical protein